MTLARKQGDSFEEGIATALAGRPGLAEFPVPHRAGPARAARTVLGPGEPV